MRICALVIHCREVTIAVSSSFSVIARVLFTIAQHYNSSYAFEATSVPVNVSIFSKVYVVVRQGHSFTFIYQRLWLQNLWRF